MPGVPYPLDLLGVKPTPQIEADRCLKKAYGHEGLRKGLEKAFQSELSDRTKPVWALPEVPEPGTPPDLCRFYFLVSSPAGPELLAAINAQHTNGISSFAKVVAEEVSRARGLDCVRKFIEDAAIPLCCREGVDVAYVNASTEDGIRVMEKLMLKENIPTGIRKICRTQFGFSLHLSSCKSPKRSK